MRGSGGGSAIATPPSTDRVGMGIVSESASTDNYRQTADGRSICQRVSWWLPADHLLVWDRVPYPQDHALHLTLIPREAVLGRITQALLQGSPPVEIAWPEDARVPRPNQEAP